MTRKGKGRGKKTKSPKHLPLPSDKGLSPISQTSQIESGDEQPGEANTSETQIPSVFVGDNDSEQAESVTEVQTQSSTFVASGGATTSYNPEQSEQDQDQRQLEVGLSQIASYSKNNSVLSPLSAVFESNLNNIRDKNTKETSTGVGATQEASARDNHEENTNKETSVNTTHSNIAWKNSTGTVNRGENGAGAESSFDSMWAKKWHELDELESARREALDKQMQEARLKLEREMNRATVEHEITMKRREIEQKQAELHQLEEMYGDSTGHLDRVVESTNSIDNVASYHSQRHQGTIPSDATQQSTSQDNSFKLQHLLERSY